MKHQENNAHLVRQFDLVPMHILREPITIIGAGAIGSWVALSLVKMGFENLLVRDFDEVSVENLSSQFYSCHDIDRKKVDALQGMISDITGVEIKTDSTHYEKGVYPGIVISAVDSMAVRQVIWENHKDRPETRFLIDPRMGAETAALYAIQPMDKLDQESYDNTLTDDSNTVQERCTGKATIFCANMLSGLVCQSVRDVLTRKDYLRVALWSVKEYQFLAFKRKS